MVNYLFSRRTTHILRFLRTNASETSLFLSPTSLQLLDVAFVLIALVIKSIFQQLGLRPSVKKFIKQDGSIELPDELHLKMPLALTDEDVSGYFEAIGRYQVSENGDLDGPQMAMFLSAVTEPAMLLLLAHRNCPIQPIGAVNVRNEIRVLRPDLATIGNIRSPGSIWIADAELKRQANWVKRGVEFEFVVSLQRKNDDQVDVIFEQRFTMLQFLRHSHPVADRSLGDSLGKGGDMITASSLIKLEASSPSEWAKACKDYNPIHTSTVMAKIFGFPGKLAHGNLVLARAIEAMQRDHADKTNQFTFKDAEKRLEIDVEFKRPVVVPTGLDVEFLVDKENSETEINLSARGKVYVQASLRAKNQ
jgi:acyl dehydratase